MWGRPTRALRSIHPTRRTTDPITSTLESSNYCHFFFQAGKFESPFLNFILKRKRWSSHGRWPRQKIFLVGVVNRRLFAKSVRRVYTTTPSTWVCVCVGLVPKYIFTLRERTRPNDDFVVVFSHQEREHTRAEESRFIIIIFPFELRQWEEDDDEKKGWWKIIICSRATRN